MTLIKSFFSVWYWFFPLEAVSYYKRANQAPAIVVYGKDGSLQMQIKGEKYAYPTFPRGHILHTSVAKLKHIVKTKIFNAFWTEIEPVMQKAELDMIPLRKCHPAVREMARVLDKMVEMELSDDMKGRMRLLRNVIVFLAQEDDAYRMRMQYFFAQMNQRKIKLSKADKYFARGKYWKTDFDTVEY